MLSLRVSIEGVDMAAMEPIERVGCAIAAKYPKERRWHALVFSDYEAAKSYKAPDSEQNEPPQYVGACSLDARKGETQPHCERK